MKSTIFAPVLSILLFCCAPVAHTALALEPVFQGEIGHNFRDYLTMPVAGQIGGRAVFNNNQAVAITGELGFPYLDFKTFMPEDENAIQRLRTMRTGGGISVRQLIGPNLLVGVYGYGDWFFVSPNYHKPEHQKSDYQHLTGGVEIVMLPFKVQIDGHKTFGLPDIEPPKTDSAQDETRYKNNLKERAYLLHWVSHDDWGSSIKVSYRYSNKIYPFAGLYGTRSNTFDFGGVLGVDYLYTAELSVKLKGMMDTKHNPYAQCGVQYVLGGHHLGGKRLRQYLRQPIERHLVPVFRGNDIDLNRKGEPNSVEAAYGIWKMLNERLDGKRYSGSRYGRAQLPSDLDTLRKERKILSGHIEVATNKAQPITRERADGHILVYDYNQDVVQNTYKVLKQHLTSGDSDSQHQESKSFFKRTSTGSVTSVDSNSATNKPKKSSSLWGMFDPNKRSGRGDTNLGLSINKTSVRENRANQETPPVSPVEQRRGAGRQSSYNKTTVYTPSKKTNFEAAEVEDATSVNTGGFFSSLGFSTNPKTPQQDTTEASLTPQSVERKKRDKTNISVPKASNKKTTKETPESLLDSASPEETGGFLRGLFGNNPQPAPTSEPPKAPSTVFSEKSNGQRTKNTVNGRAVMGVRKTSKPQKKENNTNTTAPTLEKEGQTRRSPASSIGETKTPERHDKQRNERAPVTSPSRLERKQSTPERSSGDGFRARPGKKGARKPELPPLTEDDGRELSTEDQIERRNAYSFIPVIDAEDAFQPESYAASQQEESVSETSDPPRYQSYADAVRDDRSTTGKIEAWNAEAASASKKRRKKRERSSRVKKPESKKSTSSKHHSSRYDDASSIAAGSVRTARTSQSKGSSGTQRTNKSTRQKISRGLTGWF